MMKHMKKFISTLLVVVMIFTMTMNAFAAGGTGSITINSSSTVSVAGKTFNAYKILDAVVQGSGSTQTVIYTVPAEMKNFYMNRYGLLGSEGDFDAKVVDEIGQEENLFDFASAAIAAAKAAGIQPSSATAGGSVNSVTIGNLALGYYVVEDTGANAPVSALILDTTTPNVTIDIKADKPGVDKKIDGNTDTDESTTGDVSNNNVAVGDSVPYKVSSKVPDMTGYEKYYFVLNDVLSKGLTFNNDVQIKIGSTTLTRDTDYTVSAVTNSDSTTTVEIVLKNFIQYKDRAGDVILVTYSATVNPDAEIGVTGNANKVKLIYSNNPNIDDDGDPDYPDKPTPDSPVGETPDSITRTYVTDLELIKIDTNGNRLTGAEFKIEGTKTNIVLITKDVYTVNANGTYWKLKDGTYTTTNPNTAGINKDDYEDINVKYRKSVVNEAKNTKENVSAAAVVGDDGVLSFAGLSAGQYTITEIKAPSGYNLLKDPIHVTITFKAPAASETKCTWGYTGTDVVNGEATNHITVENKSGSELPSTGGMGTTVFYVVGFILVAGAVVLLITKRRMRLEK